MAQNCKMETRLQNKFWRSEVSSLIRKSKIATYTTTTFYYSHVWYVAYTALSLQGTLKAESKPTFTLKVWIYFINLQLMQMSFLSVTTIAILLFNDNLKWWCTFFEHHWWIIHWVRNIHRVLQIFFCSPHSAWLFDSLSLPSSPSLCFYDVLNTLIFAKISLSRGCFLLEAHTWVRYTSRGN